jgi:hypothetical protein
MQPSAPASLTSAFAPIADSVRYDAADSFAFTVNGVASGSPLGSLPVYITNSSTPVVTDGDGLATLVIFALRSPPGTRTLEFLCSNNLGRASTTLSVFINSVVSSIRPLNSSPSSTPQPLGIPFNPQPSFQLCQATPPQLSTASRLSDTCFPVAGQVVVAVVESYVTDDSLDGNKMARLSGFVSAKSDLRGIVTFSDLAVLGSSSSRVYLSFYAGGKAWSTWDGSQCSPGSASRCTSYVQMSGGPTIASVISVTNVPVPLVVKEGTVFPAITVQASTTANLPVANMVMFAQFVRIAGAASPKYTTPLKFTKKLLGGFAVTNHLGQARFNLSTSVSGFAGEYDVTFLPSVTTNMPQTTVFPVITLRIASSVASVSASGPDCVVRTLIRSTNSDQGAAAFGYPIRTTLDEMKGTDPSTFFRLYFGEENAEVRGRVARYLVSARDAGFNNVPGKLVELVSDPPNALDIFADTDCHGSATDRSARANLLPVILPETGSARMCLKYANPAPLSTWSRPPTVVSGINTARFFFVVDGVISPLVVTLFLTPPLPSTWTPSVVLQNYDSLLRVSRYSNVIRVVVSGRFINVNTLILSLCDVTSLSLTPSVESCITSNVYLLKFDDGTNLYLCIPRCRELSQVLPFLYSDMFPRFFFVSPSAPDGFLSRSVGKAVLGSTPISVQFGLTTFDGSPLPASRLCEMDFTYVKRLRTVFAANSQALKVLSTFPSLSLATLSSNAYATSVQLSYFQSNASVCIESHEKRIADLSMGRSFDAAPALYKQGELRARVQNTTTISHFLLDLSFVAGLSGSVFVDVGFQVSCNSYHV